MRLSTCLTRRKTWKPEKNIKSDPQRYNIYYIEHITGGVDHKHIAPNDHLKHLSNYVCRMYKVPPAKVCVYRDDTSKKCGWCEGDYIYLNSGNDGGNIRTLLHELAHYIVFNKYSSCEGEEIFDHGPEFAAVYGYLLDRFNVLPRECFDLLCDQYDVVQANYGSPEDV